MEDSFQFQQSQINFDSIDSDSCEDRNLKLDFAPFFAEKNYDSIDSELCEDKKCLNFDDSECNEDDSTGVPNVKNKEHNNDSSFFAEPKEQMYISPSISCEDLYHCKQDTDSNSNSNKRDKFVSTKRKRDRRDYLLKTFKGKLGKYIVKTLNSVSPKIKFVLPDYKAFTQNVNYNDNKLWLGCNLRYILCQYDKKRHKNSQLVEAISHNRLALSDDKVKLLNQHLNKTYEQFAVEFTESQDYQCKDMEEYRLYVQDNKGFVECMKGSKGNKTKRSLIM